ncbi:MAG TPA: hypothetical protein ENK18_00015 [Deltaproteobacteria bacterium]|nr:hypothetical protein [Deltaproteobacteria bacterium]
MSVLRCGLVPGGPGILGILGTLGCGGSGLGSEPRGGPQLQPPIIESLSLDCDTDGGRWLLQLEASSWTGGASSFWTLDGAYIEQHAIDAIAYAEDGTGESLELSMGMVSDWRQAGPFVTAFTCAEPVDVLVVLYDLDDRQVDCRVLGPDPQRWAALDVPSCDRIGSEPTAR